MARNREKDIRRGLSTVLHKKKEKGWCLDILLGCNFNGFAQFQSKCKLSFILHQISGALFSFIQIILCIFKDKC